jgi:hypothetical protein
MCSLPFALLTTLCPLTIDKGLAILYILSTILVSRFKHGMKREFRPNRKLPRNCKWHWVRLPLWHLPWEGDGHVTAMSQETCQTNTPM